MNIILDFQVEAIQETSRKTEGGCVSVTTNIATLTG